MPIISNFPSGSGGGSGGLTLAAVSNIATLTASGKVYVKWTDPEDLVVSDSTLAAWGGTLLVRKAGSAPVSRRDGTVILDSTTRNAYADSYFCDSGLTDGVEYFYKFFPYTTANAYTDDDACAFSATPTVQVDGIDSWNVTSMVASSEAGDGKMTVKWTDPAATITSDGVTLATWASTTIVVKAGSYPTSKDDADAVYTLKETTRNQYSSSALTISGLTNGTTYYIAFFPETTDGGINTNTAQRTTGTANKITISTVPSQSGTLTYTGSAQTPSWSNYDSAKMTLSVTGQTNAGTYSATFTPTTNYRWSDGTTTAKSVSWTIAKAAGSLSLSKSSITLNTSTLTSTFTVTRAGDGAITVTSSDTSVATATISGTTVTVSHVNQKTGTATITVKVAAGTNHTAPANKTCSVTCEFVSETLDNNTWEVIKSVADAGEGDLYWDVGDTKTITINGTVGNTTFSNLSIDVFIIGFDHNSATEGTGITFQIGKLSGTLVGLCDSNYGSNSASSGYFQMNTSNTNSGGWASSYMRNTLLGNSNTPDSPLSGSLMAALPEDLRAVMKSVTKYTDNTANGGGNVSSYITTTTDYLFLLAEFEVQGARTYANSYEQNYQAQYAYYQGNAKVAYKHNATTTAAYWWLRSAYYSNNHAFCFVDTDGSAYRGSAYYSRALLPGFVI